MTDKEEYNAILMKMKKHFAERIIEAEAKTLSFLWDRLLEKEERIQELERIVYFAGLRNTDKVAADIVDSMLMEIGEPPAHAEGGRSAAADR